MKEKKKTENVIVRINADTSQVKAAIKELEKLESIVQRLRKLNVNIALNVK